MQSGETGVKMTGRCVAAFLILLNIACWLVIQIKEPMLLYKDAWFTWMLAGVLLLTALLGIWLGKRYDITHYQASRDPLTGCYNRRYTYLQVPVLLKRMARRNRRLFVTIVDVNDFKVVNDTYGHHIGDQLLQQIAEQLRQHAGKGDVIARWGGDEFLIIGPAARDEDRDGRSQRIKHILEQLNVRKQSSVKVSTGTALFPEDASSLEGLIKAADANMYHDKCGKQLAPLPKAKQQTLIV